MGSRKRRLIVTLTALGVASGLTNGVDVAKAPFCEIEGTSGPDTLSGTPDNDVICGFRGRDRIRGRGGLDVIFGGLGADQLMGGDGEDQLNGGTGATSSGVGMGLTSWKAIERGTSTEVARDRTACRQTMGAPGTSSGGSWIRHLPI